MEIQNKLFDLQISRYFVVSITISLLILHGWALFNDAFLWTTVTFVSLVMIAAFFIYPSCIKKYKNCKPAIYILTGIISYGLIETSNLILGYLHSQSPVITKIIPYLHVFPTIFLVIAICFYIKQNIEIFHRAQLKLDLFFSAIVTITATSILLFSTAIVPNTIVVFLTQPQFLSIIIDSVAVFLLIALAASNRRHVTDFAGLLIFFAVLLYITADLVNIKFIMNNSIMGNRQTDIVQLVSIILVSIGIFFATIDRNSAAKSGSSKGYINEGSIIYACWLISPVVFHFVFAGINLGNTVYYIIVFTVYFIFSNYIQKSMLTEHLLDESNNKNENLEKYILEQKGRLKSIHEDITYLVEHDKLTGMFNRDHFLKESDDILSKSIKGRPLYLIIIDIDRFRLINESYGNEIGDEVLKRMADRIRSVFDEKYSCMARLDGNEFAVLSYGFKEFSQVLRNINRLLFISKAPMNITPFQIPVKIHVGVAGYPENAGNRADLLKCAKIAVEQSKIKKMDGCCTYSSTLYEQEHRKIEIETALRKADVKTEFEVYYQPQYDVTGKTLVGMEALLRWKSPCLGLVCPTEFIPVAEETGMILEIGNWVMEAAIKQIIKWNMQYGTEFCVSINVSAIQIQNSNFIYNVRNLMAKYRVKPAWLNFEITESSAMTSIETYQEVLNELTEMGISVSIDDFGTGYSSYIYLKRASIDYLKIDKQLIDMIPTITSDAQIVNAIISMAQSLEIKTIAEGVESREQRDLLNGMGCDIIQGYFYGEPMPADEFFESHLQKQAISELVYDFNYQGLDDYSEAKMA